MDIKPRINNPNQQNVNPNTTQSVAESASIIFNLKDNRKLKIQKAKIKQITKGLSEIAFDLGETNDKEEFAEELAEEIYESMKSAKNKIQRKQKK
ncbi:hypothetical protein DID76_03845 [Candidatus Marinamargulisbacteria bacterium SCGC AG-414-C22]|nr:hypothetical protein DID76_03845 [Candidatus Marinamargulisbacteria bacterium SCGC AG-414-C22]